MVHRTNDRGGTRSRESQRDSIAQPRVDPQRGATLGHRPTKLINPERVESNRRISHYSVVPQSLAKILVHTVFSSKDRRPFLRDKSSRDELHRYLGGILTHLECQPIIVGGVEDHVHLLCSLSRTCDAAAMVKEVKRGSSL